MHQSLNISHTEKHESTSLGCANSEVATTIQARRRKRSSLSVNVSAAEDIKAVLYFGGSTSDAEVQSFRSDLNKKIGEGSLSYVVRYDDNSSMVVTNESLTVILETRSPTSSPTLSPTLSCTAQAALDPTFRDFLLNDECKSAATPSACKNSDYIQIRCKASCNGCYNLPASIESSQPQQSSAEGSSGVMVITIVLSLFGVFLVGFLVIRARQKDTDLCMHGMHHEPAGSTGFEDGFDVDLLNNADLDAANFGPSAGGEQDELDEGDEHPPSYVVSDDAPFDPAVQEGFDNPVIGSLQDDHDTISHSSAGSGSSKSSQSSHEMSFA